MDLTERFEQCVGDGEDDRVFQCSICLCPKLSFVTLAPCGHSTCQPCSQRIDACPECRAAVTHKIVQPQLAQAAASRVRYRCLRAPCEFRGSEAEARDHDCRIARFRAIGCCIPEEIYTDLIKRMPHDTADSVIIDTLLEVNQYCDASYDAEPNPAAAVEQEPSAVAPLEPSDTPSPAAVLTQQPSPSSRALPPAALFDHSAPGNALGASGGAVLPVAPSTAPLPPPVVPALLLWDYDGVDPSHVGMSSIAFLNAMVAALREKGVALRDYAAYLVAGRDYGSDPDKLKRLQIDIRMRATESDHADLSRELRRRAAELERTGRRGCFVIVSSDERLIPDVKALTDAREDGTPSHQVWMVHDAIAGSDHCFALSMYATGTLHLRSFAAPSGAASSAAPPHRMVWVGPEQVDASTLVDNAAVRHLLAHPGKRGRWCQRKGALHDASQCRFVHAVSERSRPPTAASTADTD